MQGVLTSNYLKMQHRIEIKFYIKLRTHRDSNAVFEEASCDPPRILPSGEIQVSQSYLMHSHTKIKYKVFSGLRKKYHQNNTSTLQLHSSLSNQWTTILSHIC